MAKKERRKVRGNPAEQEMAKFDNSLSMWMGANENDVQNDPICSGPRDTSGCGRRLAQEHLRVGSGPNSTSIRATQLLLVLYIGLSNKISFVQIF